MREAQLTELGKQVRNRNVEKGWVHPEYHSISH